MTIPPYYPSYFTSNAGWTFDEGSSVPVGIPSNFITGGDLFSYSNAIVIASGAASSAEAFAPSMDPIQSFSAVAGRNYRLTVTMRVNSQPTNGVSSLHRPGFVAYPTANTVGNAYQNGVIIGPSFGAGLETINGATFTNTGSWVVGQYYEVGCNWIADQDYAVVFPRIRINRNELDTQPYSDVALDIMEFNVQPEIKLSDIVTEFGGNSPPKLSDYYRKTINSAIMANVVSVSSEANAILFSEVGSYPTTITQYSDYTTDYGNLFPLDEGLAGIAASGEIGIINVPGVGNVIQSQGILWGGVDQVKSYGQNRYFKINSSDTYTLSANKRLLSIPTNDTANTPVVYIGLVIWDANGTVITGVPYGSFTLQLNTWVNTSVSVTGASILATYPTAVFGRVYTIDNQYYYVDAVGIGVTEALNCVVQTSTLSVTSTGTLIGGTGITTLYDLSDGDVVRSLSGGTWSVVANATSNSELFGPRQATNPYSKRIFRIGDFFVVDRPENTNIPTSGQIKFSDFYGSQQSAGPLFLTSGNMGTYDGNHPITYTVTAYSKDNLPIRFATRDTRPELTMTGPVANTVTIGGITYSANTVTFTGNALYTDAALYPVGFYLDASDEFLTNTLNPVYYSLNNPPVWNSPANLGTYGSSLQLSATDPEYQPVAYALANGTTLPAGLSLSATGLISGTPSSAGTFTFSVSASDGPFESFQNFTLTTT